MIGLLFAAQIVMMDYTEVNRLFTESEQMIVHQCETKPETCQPAADADVSFVKSLEGTQSDE